jgi:hypothetical protein
MVGGMRLMVMHKVDAAMEAGEKPDQTLISNMGKLVGRSLKSGVFVDGAGLHRSAARARVTLAGGKASVERGPYAGGNELVASFAMITAASIEHAIELATQLAKAGGADGEIEVGPVVEGWDLNGSPRPANAPWRFLLLRKADAAFEAGTPTPPAVQAVLDEWKAAGTLQSAAALAPSARGKRYQAGGGKRTWIDGPFAESKELVAGFSIIDVPGWDEAMAWTAEYGAILGNNQVDVRVVA